MQSAQDFRTSGDRSFKSKIIDRVISPGLMLVPFLFSGGIFPNKNPIKLTAFALHTFQVDLKYSTEVMT